MRYNTVGDKMKKIKLYLDTSIINFAINDKSPAEKKLTQRLLEEIKQGEYEAFISELVTAEIDKAPQEIAIKLRDIIKGLEIEELSIDEEVESLADEYVKQGIIPARYGGETGTSQKGTPLADKSSCGIPGTQYLIPLSSLTT